MTEQNVALNTHVQTTGPLESVDLRAVRQANVFCSSPFFLRHALVIISWLKSNGVSVTVWSHENGAVGPALEALALQEVRLRSWPQLPVSPRVSRPWTLIKTKLFFDRFYKSAFQNAEESLSFYEEDYPEPCLHALIARCSRNHRVYKYGYSGHDTVPASHVPAPIRLRESLIACAYGFSIAFFSRQGMPDSQNLPFLDSSRWRVQKVECELSEEAISPFRVPIAADPSRPVLLLLESQDEEESCRNYRCDINRLLDLLEAEGWQIFSKGHPRLGSSGAIVERGTPLLDNRIPLELFDLSGVEAVVGLCSSGMFSTSLAGIPTYCVENLFRRHDPARRASSIAFLTTDPGWNPKPIHIDILNGWEEVRRIRPRKTEKLL